MPLDGVTLNSVVQELDSALVGGRVDKIQQPEKDEIILAVRSRGKNYKLLLTANANSPRLHLSKSAKGNPAQAPMFCMLLRKHLGGGRIVKIVQPEFERIVNLYIESPNEMGDVSMKCLVIEIMGKHSNIMLLDSGGVIMDSIRHVSRELSSVREVLPGKAYARPPGKLAPMPLDEAHFFSLFREEVRQARQHIYQTYNGVSPVLGSEICLRADVPPDAVHVTDDNSRRIRDAFLALYDDVECGRFECRIYGAVGGKRDFSSVPLKFYEGEPKTEPFDSPSEMLETFYRSQDTHYRMAQKTSDLRKLVTNHIERCQRKEQIFGETLRGIEDREQLRRYGELLTSYIYAIPEGADRAKVADFYDEGKEIEIPLDPMLSPAENAQVYFKGYNKAKRTFAALQEQSETNTNDLRYLDSVLAAMLSVTNEDDITEIRSELAEQGFLKKRPARGKEKQKKSKPLEYRSTDGFGIFVGKNNTQNDELTLRFARSADIWLHTKEIAGSHVIIQAGGRDVPEQTIREAALLAAFHSKGRQSSQVPVDYTSRRHVRKPRGAKPGFVIYDFHKTIYVTPEGALEEKLRGV